MTITTLSFSDGERVVNHSTLYSQLSKDWLQMELKHRISKQASNELWSLATSALPKLHDARKNQHVKKKIPQFRSIRDSLYKNNVPEIKLQIAYRVKETGDIIILKDLKKTPISRFPPSKFIKLYESASVQVRYR